MTYDRDHELKEVVNSLLAVSFSSNIILYDSGRRKNIEEYARSQGVSYVSSGARNAKENFLLILEQVKSRVFIHHDDDLVLPAINNVKKAILEQNLLFSTSLKISDPTFNFSKNLNEIQKIEKILELYFLSANRNCPLISGLYIDNRRSWNFRKQYQITGRHDDVGIIIDLFTRHKSHIFNYPYVNYNDETLGENSIKDLSDRKNLAYFLRNLPSKKSKLFTLLSTIKGPRQKLHFIKLIIELIKSPNYIFKFILKVFYFK